MNSYEELLTVTRQTGGQNLFIGIRVLGRTENKNKHVT